MTLAEASAPVIETRHRPRHPLGFSVGFSNTKAAALMMTHLHDRGCRRIAFLGGEPCGDHRGERRDRSHLVALQKRDLGPPRIMRPGRTPRSMQPDDPVIERLGRGLPDATAPFCVSDLVAFGAIMACHRRGWAVACSGQLGVSRICSHPASRRPRSMPMRAAFEPARRCCTRCPLARKPAPGPSVATIAMPVGIAARASAWRGPVAEVAAAIDGAGVIPWGKRMSLNLFYLTGRSALLRMRIADAGLDVFLKERRSRRHGG